MKGGSPPLSCEINRYSKRKDRRMRIEYALINPADIYDLYERLGWNQYVNLDQEKLNQVMAGSYHVVYVYAGTLLVGTGRIISDGYLTALVCGVGVDPSYEKQGIGTMILEDLIRFAQRRDLDLELFCDETLEAYYEKFGFQIFTSGMKKSLKLRLNTP